MHSSVYWSGYGSSPRLWGTANVRRCNNCCTRFIPTPVGNGSLRHGLISKCAVHPHACGERLIQANNTFPSGGSSPRLWGTAGTISHNGQFVRFIPTPVGNGAITYIIMCIHTVHPHACGERIGDSGLPQTRSGSSPRLWGTVIGFEPSKVTGRFIPTPVGNGNGICRVRKLPIGSSPRLWGTGYKTFANKYVERFIPTPVGNGLIVDS